MQSQSNPPPRDEQAIAWFVRLKEGASETDRKAFRQWLALDPRNHDAFNAAKKLWTDLEEPAAYLGAEGWHRTTLTARRGYLLGLRAAAACLGVAVVCAGLLWRDDGLLVRAFADHATSPGQSREVVLEDGSRVYLDGDSAISTDFGPATRHVHLMRGRVWFDVARQADVAFEVSAGGAEIRVLGTAFAVDREADTTAVTVERGRVAVTDAGGAKLDLTAGLQATVTGGRLEGTTAVDPETAIAWRRGLIVLDQAPLGRVVDELARMRPGRVVIPDRQLRDLRLSGVFSANDPEAVLEAFHSALGLKTLSVPGLATVVYR